ncbi:VOC family protein [Roseibacillus persicicus]|uniref:VOC family protein n=1 Tax=Roseibacillus persicicus TaxID=454148 RepID=UPI0031F30B1A
MQSQRPFHLAYSISDLEATRKFYGKILGCREGRSTEQWIDFDFWGNQLSLHLGTFVESSTESQVAGKSVPMPHFGAVLEWHEFHALASRLKDAGSEFIEEPQIRFADEPGEQATFFVKDPSGNALEFKSFKNPEGLFEK